MVRIVLSKIQYEDLRAFISKVDPPAFITITTTKAVFGEGFKPNKALVGNPLLFFMKLPLYAVA